MDFFTDVHVRRGLAYCMDIDTLIGTTLAGDGVRSRGPIPPGLQGYDATSPVYAWNASLAAQEFQQAWGGQAGSTGFTFQIVYDSGDAVREATAVLLSGCVTALNPKFHVSPLGVPRPSLRADLINGEWTVGVSGWTPDYLDASDFMVAFMDGRPNNGFGLYLGYNNASVQALIDQGLTETDVALRDEIYREIQLAAYYDVPGVWTYTPTRFVVYRSWIGGWYFQSQLGGFTYCFDYVKGLPSPPRNLQPSPGVTDITLSWNPPADDGGHAITAHTVYRGTNAGSLGPFRSLGNVTQYVDASVSPGVTYYYTVAAVNAIGEGPQSGIVFARTRSSPDAPRNLRATGGDRVVDLAWDAPASDGGSPVLAYRVYRGTVPGAETFLVSAGTFLVYSDGTVANGVTYYYRVTAENLAGEGPPSNEVVATPGASDTAPPSIAVTFPVEGAVLMSTSVTVTGTASDDVEVAEAELSTDGVTWTPASTTSGWASWSGTLTLVEGPNTIHARATDTSGKTQTVMVDVIVNLAPPDGGPFTGTLLTVGLIAVVAAVSVAAFLLVRRRRSGRLRDDNGDAR